MLPDRLTALPEYAFPRLRALLADLEPGASVVDFSIGEPKHAPPEFARAVLDQHFNAYTRYPPVDGTEGWRAAVRGWLGRRYGAPEAWFAADGAILPLNGTREGLYMAIMANTPESKAGGRPAVLLPNPFYQCYAAAALSAGAEPIYLSATDETGHLPTLDLPDPLLRRTSAFFVCSPANPQGAVASLDYWTRLLTLAERYDFIVFADECYSEIYRDAPPPGALEAVLAIGADPNRLLAFHSLSKRSNLAGLRSGFVVGGREPVDALKQLKAYGGAPCPVPALHAAEAVWNDEEHVAENRALYARKFTIADDLLTSWPTYRSPEAGFFLWIPVHDGEAAARALWRDAGLKALPGAYLSRPDADGRDPGADHIRLALVAPVEEVEEGLTRLAQQLSRHAEAWQGDSAGEASDLLEHRTQSAGPSV